MIEFKHLTKLFGKTVAVYNLKLEVRKGEVFGLLGPNGAGKTTTLKIMAGLLRPTSGTVLVNGIDVTKEPERAKSIMGFVPDRPFLYSKLTGREFMRFIGTIYGIEDGLEKRIEELLELFDLKDWMDEMVEAYSHGMRQRLTMASAFLHHPLVLVIDEPMIGLDPVGLRMLRNIFKEMSKRGGTVFMSTHILDLARDVCTRMGIINNGKLIAVGSMEELKEEAKTEKPDLEEIFLKLTGKESVVRLIETF